MAESPWADDRKVFAILPLSKFPPFDKTCEGAKRLHLCLIRGISSTFLANLSTEV